jgi:6-phosphogluconolactonase/glucosamine-6-phosphate isomerase/deaminase
LTLPFINASKAVLFMLSGPKKQEIVEQILDGTHDYPAGLVRPTNGTTAWYVGV